MRSLGLAMLVISLTALVATAQPPLTDRVPDDAIVYIGWRGAEDPGERYEGSHTQAVIQASGFPELFKQFLPALIHKLRTRDEKGAEAMETIVVAGATLWRHPSVLYFGGIDMSDPEQPRPRLALLCRAGDEAQLLVDRMDGLVQQATELPFPILASARQDGLVVVSTFELPEQPEGALAGNERFTAAIANVHEDPLAIVYVDGEGLLQLIDMLVHARGDADAIRNWPTLRDASGLAGLKSFAWSAAFEDADWGSRAFIEVPAPRRGIFALLDSPPLPEALLRTVPKSATLLAAGGMDLSRVLAEVRAAAKAIGPEAAKQVEKGLSAASLMLGANVEKDLIDPLGTHWAVYASPDVGGNGLLGLTGINHLDDPGRADRSLGLLEILISNMITMQTRKQKDPPRIAFRTTQSAGGMTVHYLPVPLVAPAWGVRERTLFVGLFPQVVTAAARQAEEGADSILDNEAFRVLRKRLGAEKASGIQFLDLPEVGPDGYTTVLAFTQLGLGFADMKGIAAPILLPPLDRLRPHFAPSMSIARSDERGIYFHKITPFPGADYFGAQSQALLGQNAMMMSILLPSLNRARETANRVKSASSLRQLGQGMLLFSNENRGAYPPDLPTYAAYMRQLDPRLEAVFDSPLGDATGGDYVFLFYDGLKSSASADVIVAYDAAALNRREGRDGTNLLFADGRVEWMNPAEIQRAIKRSKEADPRSVPHTIPLPGMNAAAGEAASPVPSAP